MRTFQVFYKRRILYDHAQSADSNDRKKMIAEYTRDMISHGAPEGAKCGIERNQTWLIRSF